MPFTRGYSAGMLMFEVAGEPAGLVRAVEGGELFATVVHEPPGGDPFVGKHLGTVDIEPIRVSFGVGMKGAFYDWVSEFTRGERPRRSGAIVFTDYNGVERSRLEFDDALISDLRIPMLDAASHDQGWFAVTIVPAQVRHSSSQRGQVTAGSTGTPKRWMVANFRLQIEGADGAAVSWVEAITISQAVTRSSNDPADLQAAALDAPDLAFAVARSGARDFETWFDDAVVRGNLAQERSGSLAMLDATLTTPLFSLDLSGLGICRLDHERSQAGAEVVARVRVQTYSRRMAFATSQAAKAVEPPPAPAPEPGPAPSEAGAGTFVRSQLDPAVIARRLKASAAVESAQPASPSRERGRQLGQQWASEKASLDELRAVASLEARNWSALHLPVEHSLSAVLSGAGRINTDAEALDLERDGFVEGLVSGAAQVLASVTPHLD